MSGMQTAIRRLRTGRRYSLAAARRWTAAALVLQWVIVVTGATVRLTGSGLGCPNWPTCTGDSAVPGADMHALIEFGNRLVSTPTLITALVAWWVARRLIEPRRDVRLAALLVLLGVPLQALIGASIVLLELPPTLVGLHFVASVAILAAATFAAMAARRDEPLRVSWRVAPLAAGMLLACALTIVLGVLTTAAGPHTGAETGVVVSRIGEFSLAVMLHARVAYFFAGCVVFLTVLRRRTRAGVGDLGLLTVLVAVQIALGEVQYRSGLPWQVVLAHVACAMLVWIVTCRVAIAALAVTSGPASRARTRTLVKQEGVGSGAAAGSSTISA